MATTTVVELAIESTAPAKSLQHDGQTNLEDFAVIEPPSSLQDNTRPACFSNTLQECLFVLTVTMAIGQDAIFSGLILCITSHIGKDLNMTAAEVTWIAAGQNLTAGCFLLLFGRAADLFGRRATFLTSMVGFSVCLLIMGFATNAYYMDVFCGICGIFSAMAVPPAVGKLGAVYSTPSTRKNRAFACFSAGNPVGFAIGAFISGVTMVVANWRAAIWVVCVIYALFTVVAFFTVPADVEQESAGFNRSTLAQFDFIGAFLIMAGMALSTAALTLAGSAPEGWRTPYLIAILITGFFLIAAFLYWQYIYSHPLMPLSVWKDRNYALLVSTLCLGMYGMSGNEFWVTLYWQRILNDPPILVATKLLPMMIGGLAINIIAAMIMHRINNKILMILGAASFVLSDVLFSVANRDSSYWEFFFLALLLSVVAADFEYTVTNMYVMSSLPSEHQSVAGGMFSTATRLASTIGIGVQTSVYNSLSGGEGGHLYRPYRSTFWVSLAGGALALFLVPFLTIKKQGVKNE